MHLLGGTSGEIVSMRLAVRGICGGVLVCGLGDTALEYGGHASKEVLVLAYPRVRMRVLAVTLTDAESYV